jgi:hypothetical protein
MPSRWRWHGRSAAPHGRCGDTRSDSRRLAWRRWGAVVAIRGAGRACARRARERCCGSRPRGTRTTRSHSARGSPRRRYANACGVSAGGRPSRPRRRCRWNRPRRKRPRQHRWMSAGVRTRCCPLHRRQHHARSGRSRRKCSRRSRRVRTQTCPLHRRQHHARSGRSGRKCPRRSRQVRTQTCPLLLSVLSRHRRRQSPQLRHAARTRTRYRSPSTPTPLTGDSIACSPTWECWTTPRPCSERARGCRGRYDE